LKIGALWILKFIARSHAHVQNFIWLIIGYIRDRPACNQMYFNFNLYLFYLLTFVADLIRKYSKAVLRLNRKTKAQLSANSLSLQRCRFCATHLLNK